MAAYNIVFPKNITFTNWVCQLRNSNKNLNVPLPPDDENDWENWVETLIYNNPKINIPLPADTKDKKLQDWVTWAEHFIQIVYN